MTHDELLAECSRPIMMSPNLTEDDWVEINRATSKLLALRAVVELHKPVVSPLYGDMVCTCTHTGDWQYPCPTIQAIEKELK